METGVSGLRGKAELSVRPKGWQWAHARSAERSVGMGGQVVGGSPTGMDVGLG